MSRVDEARRRAAELAGAGAGVGFPADLPLAPLPQPDVPANGADVFPVEEGSRDTPSARPRTPAPATDAGARDTTEDGPAAQPDPFDSIRDEVLHKLVIGTAMSPAWREQYRQLAATLHKSQGQTGVKVVMVASAAVGEGKTLTAANLALTFSESYKRRVLLLDGDLRRPALHELFGLDNDRGLGDALASRNGNMDLPARHLSPRLDVLTTGRLRSDPMADLISERMQRLLQQARAAYDWVLIDTPPIGLMPDASLLSAMTDAAIMVIKADATPYDLVARAADAIGRQKIAGAVLNRAMESPSSRYGYNYDRYYHGDTGEPRNR